MARSRRGGGGGGSMFARKPARPAAPARRAASTVPARKPPSAPPAVAAKPSGGMLSGIGSTIAQGMAFGTGSAIAHQAVGAAVNSMSGSSDKGEMVQQPMEASVMQQPTQGVLDGPCAQDKSMFFDCLKVNQGDQQSCSFLYDTLQSCQRNEAQMSFN